MVFDAAEKNLEIKDGQKVRTVHVAACQDMEIFHGILWDEFPEPHGPEESHQRCLNPFKR